MMRTPSHQVGYEANGRLGRPRQVKGGIWQTACVADQSQIFAGADNEQLVPSGQVGVA